MADDTTTTTDSGQDGSGQPEPGQGTLDARMGRLEATQQEQGSKLDRILELLPGRNSSDDGGGDAGAGAPGGQDVQSQVRAEIAAAKAREAEEARAKGDTEWRQTVEAKLEELKPEKTPREAAPGWRGKLQRAMFGPAE